MQDKTNYSHIYLSTKHQLSMIYTCLDGMKSLRLKIVDKGD